MTGLCFTFAFFINLQHDIIFYHSETEMHCYLFYNLGNNFNNADFSVKSAVRSTFFIYFHYLFAKQSKAVLTRSRNKLWLLCKNKLLIKLPL